MFWTVIIIIVVGVIITIGKQQASIAKLNPLASIPSLKYLGGIPGRPSAIENVTLVITKTSLTVVSVTGASVLVVPREAIRAHSVEDATQAFQRLTVTRMALLGPLALAAPKTRKDVAFLLHLVWHETDGNEREMLFEIAGIGAQTRANNASELLRTHFRTPSLAAASAAAPIGRPALDEPAATGLLPETASTRPCPYCAETIQRAARLCKHCRSTVEPLI